MRLKALIARQQWSDEGFYRAVNKDDRIISLPNLADDETTLKHKVCLSGCLRVKDAHL
jgi:hypothetical protein